jgi:hypothetical protein
MDAGLKLEGARKRAKFRSVWISFAGRIAAQLIGAIATVTLGVAVLGKGHSPAPSAEQAAAAKPTVLIATPVRTHGETVIVMLPVGKNGQVDEVMAREVAESFEKTKTFETAKTTVRRADARRQTPTDPPAPQSGDLSADTRVTLESPHE